MSPCTHCCSTECSPAHGEVTDHVLPVKYSTANIHPAAHDTQSEKQPTSESSTATQLLPAVTIPSVTKVCSIIQHSSFCAPNPELLPGDGETIHNVLPVMLRDAQTSTNKINCNEHLVVDGEFKELDIPINLIYVSAEADGQNFDSTKMEVKHTFSEYMDGELLFDVQTDCGLASIALEQGIEWSFDSWRATSVSSVDIWEDSSILSSAVDDEPIIFFDDKEDTNKPFHIYCDASNSQHRAVIVQDNHPVAYYSCKSTSAQRNCKITKKESLSIIKTLREYQSLILSAPNIHIYTDHRNIMYNA